MFAEKVLHFEKELYRGDFMGGKPCPSLLSWTDAERQGLREAEKYTKMMKSRYFIHGTVFTENLKYLTGGEGI
jgi:hypothetical protein